MVTERKITKKLYRFFVSAVLAGFFAVIADAAFAWLGGPLSVSVFVLLGTVLTLAFFLIPWFTGKRLTIAAGALISVLVLSTVAMALCWSQFGRWAVYQRVDTGKAQVYAGHRVMVIVPHEDDELNILGGAMEEYINYGSEVYPVFVTNGDYDDQAEIRFREAIAVCEYIGIPQENAIFLGYGDQWAKGGPHLYNAMPGQIVESQNRRTETYGTGFHPAFREGQAYTVENLLGDIEAVILQYKPDVIYCSDYDSHIDHKAVTLAFEKVMGKILRENETYRPSVYKGYAYTTAWTAIRDYYAVNLGSTLDVFVNGDQYPETYRWEERLRLPVDAATLSRSLLQSKAYETMHLHLSQDANMQAPAVVNGDKVFWKRDTNSLCYSAAIETSSSDGKLLNDFMLLENENLVDAEHQPFDGVWIPDGEDAEKCVTVTLEEPADIHSIVLYDHPSEEHNVLQARILFDDGSEILTGPLDAGGAASAVLVEKGAVSSFQICLTAVEGDMAGLTEIEAYPTPPEELMKLLKIVDDRDDFVYDYWLPKTGTGEFRFYTYGGVPAVNAENYTVTSSNPACEAVLKGETLRISCPVGETATITVKSVTEDLSDSIFVQNPGFFVRLQCDLCQWVEETLFVGYCEGRHWQLATVKVLDLVRKWIF